MNAKCHLVNLDRPSRPIEALFNPTEIILEKTVPWNRHKNPKGNCPMLEFTYGENRVLSTELLFDERRTGRDVSEAYVSALYEMTLAPPGAFVGLKAHPPLVMFVWGGSNTEYRRFKGVLTSLTTKYTFFLPSGVPVRATCSIKIKEVHSMQENMLSSMIGGLLGG